jgi:hypothetical protein
MPTRVYGERPKRLQTSDTVGGVRRKRKAMGGISWIPNLASARRALLDYVISV